MSRVHEALRRVEAGIPAHPEPPPAPDALEPESAPHEKAIPAHNGGPLNGTKATAAVAARMALHREMLPAAKVLAYQPAPESHLLDLENSLETPAEEFRTLRTRLNHLQTLQPLHTVVVTSPSPAEGKTFTAVNLAIAQAQLAERSVLMGDFDLRRPVVHNLFQIDRAPGLTDYLQGECEFSDALRRIDGLNLYVLPAGTAVKNPLEILNTRQAKLLFEELPRIFDWAIFDTPPLLFSADANLLATLADGTILVVKIGSTTFDNVTRAMQSLCENNVLGIVANGARASELYSKYTYYYSKAEAE
ncbi:MAG TPA: CpsD/CapB family tyrosine-protein kinase [Bryobacteraceae bacterium]|nr:CpsD/CapB family tyrosine-protein kinase [Bryobacteraceae bacterium]